MVNYIWSLESNLGDYGSNEVFSFNIYVDKEYKDPISSSTIIKRMSNLQFEEIYETEKDKLPPETVTVTVNNENVLVEGFIDAQAIFVDIAYSSDGYPREVDTIDEIPKGAKAFKLIPDDNEYKYYRWLVKTYDEYGIYGGELEEPILVEREFFIRIRLSWDAAKKEIIRIAGEIE